jgi:hypothetical protein
MTIGELLDHTAFNTDDDDGDYRAAMRRWLNLTRSWISDESSWKHALDSSASFNTSAATTDGIYTLDGYEFIAGDALFDETQSHKIRHESMTDMLAADADKSVTGPPDVWADAGMNSNGVRLIYLWPIPSDVRTISFRGYRNLTDLTEDREVLSVDPFFGPVAKWQSTFEEGLRYYQMRHDGDGFQVVVGQRGVVKSKIREMKKRDRLSIGTLRLGSAARVQDIANLGRFYPAHFSNR